MVENPPPKASRSVAMLDMGPRERVEAQLRVLEGLMGATVARRKYAEAAKIYEQIRDIVSREGQ